MSGPCVFSLLLVTSNITQPPCAFTPSPAPHCNVKAGDRRCMIEGMKAMAPGTIIMFENRWAALDMNVDWNDVGIVVQSNASCGPACRDGQLKGQVRVFIDNRLLLVFVEDVTVP